MHPNVKALIEREYAAQKSEEWLALRGNLLTASDAATAIGVNKYETPDDLLRKKCGIGKKFTGNEATRHGEKYEDEARILYEQRHNEVVHELGLVPHPVHTWLGGSPDGVTESGKLVEIKCPPTRQILPEVPDHYMPSYNYVCRFRPREADFIEYKPAETNWPKPEEFQVINVKRDPEWWKTNFPMMKQFWEKVLYYREHLDELPKPEREEDPQEERVPPPVCEIEPDPNEDFYHDD
jgi:putative phage-type endonuclease